MHSSTYLVRTAASSVPISVEPLLRFKIYLEVENMITSGNWDVRTLCKVYVCTLQVCQDRNRHIRQLGKATTGATQRCYL